MPLIDQNLSYVLAYARRIANRYYYRIPYEDRITWSREDLAQDFLAHIIKQEGKYDASKEAKPWIRTVIYNRAITCVNQIWTERRRNVSLAETGVDFGSVTFGWTEEEAEIITVDYFSPEVVLEIVQEIATKMAKKVTVNVDEVQELSEMFGVEFASEDVQGTLDKVLEATLNDMTEEDFNALEEAVQARLKELGEAVESDALTVSTKKKGRGGGGGGGPGRSNPDGPVAKIREHFAAGIQSVPEMIEKMKELGVECSPATVKTQVGRLRKEAGLTTGSRGRSPASSGILYSIRKAYHEMGLKTVAEVAEYLTKEKIEFSPATVKTQVGRLRKEEGLTNKTEKPAEKPAKAKKEDEKEKADKPAPSTKKAAAPATKKGSRRRRRSS